MCILISPGIHFSSPQPLLTVPTMHGRSMGVSTALEAHTRLLSCYEPPVCNPIHNCRVRENILYWSSINTEFNMYQLFPVGPVYCIIQVSFMTALNSSSYTINLWWYTNCFTWNQTSLTAK